jgi:hypothetical protein
MRIEHAKRPAGHCRNGPSNWAKLTKIPSSDATAAPTRKTTKAAGHRKLGSGRAELSEGWEKAGGRDGGQQQIGKTLFAGNWREDSPSQSPI